MIERLLYSKAYLYKAEPINGKKSKIRWQLVKKIENMDREIESSDLLTLNFYSPDFSQFIEVDRREKQFVIKDTLTNQVIRIIPKELMTYSAKEKPLSVMNRF